MTGKYMPILVILLYSWWWHSPTKQLDAFLYAFVTTKKNPTISLWTLLFASAKMKQESTISARFKQCSLSTGSAQTATTRPTLSPPSKTQMTQLITCFHPPSFTYWVSRYFKITTNLIGYFIAGKFCLPSHQFYLEKARSKQFPNAGFG